jgi:hypothetical protein
VANRPERVWKSSVGGWLVVAAAALVAVVSARDYAGGWYDGSRLATVECLVDYHTLAIDHSIFVEVPSRTDPNQPSPYPAHLPHLLQGTGDRMWIAGHFYSDKSPVPALWMAGVYQVWQWTTGMTAREHPNRFCYGMTLASSGLAYVVAVGSIYQLGVRLSLSRLLRWSLPLSLGLSTMALPYVRHVNNHILLLGVVAGLMVGLMGLAEAVQAGGITYRRLVGLGTVTGLGYAIDLAAGPFLLVCTVVLVARRCRRWSFVGMLILAALPWLAVHYAINYALSGTLRPASAVPANWQWPGSPFSAQNLTGVYNHSSLLDFWTYALALLFGNRGFLLFNPPLLLAIPGGIALMRGRTIERPEIFWAAAWSAGVWLVYALFSIQFPGQCYSIRWFVPLLAPGYLVLAVFLQKYPRYGWAFLLMSGWGSVLSVAAWWRGPWVVGH